MSNVHPLGGIDITPPMDRWQALDPASWAGQPVPPRRYLVEGWIPLRQVTFLTGDGATGKSLLGQQLATCVAANRPFLGLPTIPTAALYLTCEDDSEELHRRQDAICRSLGIGLDHCGSMLRLASLVGNPDTSLIGPDALVTPAYSQLVDLIDQCCPIRLGRAR